jgi:hypothetical protein
MFRHAKRAFPRRAVRSAILALVTAWGWFAGVTAQAHAEVILGITTDSAVAGSSTNSLDVTLTNSGSSAVCIAGFSFELNAIGANAGFLTFTDATVNTIAAPYIFAGNSFVQTYLLSDDITPNDVSGDYGQTIDASDLFTTPDLGASVAAGQTVSLGNVLFTLSSTASSPITLEFTSYPSTSISSAGTTSSDLPFTTSGSMSIHPASVPELPSGILIATAAGLGAVVRFRRQVLGKALARFGFHQRSIQ